MCGTLVHLLICRICSVLAPKPLWMVISLVQALAKVSTFRDGVFDHAPLQSLWSAWRSMHIDQWQPLRVPTIKALSLVDHAVFNTLAATEEMLANGTALDNTAVTFMNAKTNTDLTTNGIPTHWMCQINWELLL